MYWDHPAGRPGDFLYPACWKVIVMDGVLSLAFTFKVF